MMMKPESEMVIQSKLLTYSKTLKQSSLTCY